MAEDFYQCFEQVLFVCVVFADKDIDKVRVIKGQGDVIEVFVLADGEPFQAHRGYFISAPSRH
jgi:hypothetical protein